MRRLMCSMETLSSGVVLTGTEVILRTDGSRLSSGRDVTRRTMGAPSSALCSFSMRSCAWSRSAIISTALTMHGYCTLFGSGASRASH